MKMIFQHIKKKTKVGFILFPILLLFVFSFLSINISAQSCTQCTSASGWDDDYFFTPLITISCAPAGATITSVEITMSIGASCPSWYEMDLWANGAYHSTYCNGTYTFNDWNGLVANGQTFRIRAWDNDFWSDWVTLNLCVKVFYTIPCTPAAPVATAATGITSAQFTANWNASASATSYYLDVATNAGFTVFVPGYNNLNVGNVTNYVVSGLNCNTTYYYRVRASCGGTSGNSNTITVTTAAACPTTYLHPTTGIAGEYVGSCQVATSNGTYYDDGGAAGNYSTNIDATYRIFCPNSVGQCLTATFTFLDIYDYDAFWCGGCCDILWVTNGSTQNSPLLYSGCGPGPIGPFTGTINGCLGFRFASDGSVTRPGWAATLSMAPCAGGPNGTDNNDCSNTTLICSNVAVPGNSTGPGISAEACGGAAGCPAGGENYSNWYSVSFVTNGTFNFTIVPAVGTDDYDYAVYGPGVTCGALGNALRCSDAYLTGNTGLSGAAGDVTEDVNGDKFTAQMNVLAGQTYYIMVDEWTPTGAGYNLNLGGTATISCVPLPVKLLSFDATYEDEKKAVNLTWVTETEINNDYFVVERSLDGTTFEQISVVKGAGNSSFTRYYFSTDTEPYPGEINYYRLKQVDFDGNFEYSYISAVVINDPLSKFSVYPNPATESATILFHAVNTKDYRLNIYDYTSKLILSYNFKSERGKNLIPLDLKGFNQGVYFINIQGNGEMLKTTFIKE